MSEDSPRIKVRRGQQVFGPMALTELAELLAEGRVDESDLVSEQGGPWIEIDEYVRRQSESAAPAPVPGEPPSVDDDFDCIPDPPAAPTKPVDAGPDSDYLLETTPDESGYVPLSEDGDPPADSRSVSSDSAETYGIPSPLPKEPAAASGFLPPTPAEDISADDRPSSSDPLPDESDFDDVLQALAQDEDEAPELEPPRLGTPRRKRASDKAKGPRRSPSKRPGGKRKRHKPGG